jgi:hypothetical protein
MQRKRQSRSVKKGVVWKTNGQTAKQGERDCENGSHPLLVAMLATRVSQANAVMWAKFGATSSEIRSGCVFSYGLRTLNTFYRPDD